MALPLRVPAAVVDAGWNMDNGVVEPSRSSVVTMGDGPRLVAVLTVGGCDGAGVDGGMGGGDMAMVRDDGAASVLGSLDCTTGTHRHMQS